MSDDKKLAEPPHVESLRRQDRLNKLSARNRFRVACGRVEKYEALSSVDLEAAVTAAVKAHERSANLKIGERDGRGILLGVWEPKDRNGNSLKQKFNVFAAPEDLPQADTYNNTVEHVSLLKNWHGHDGAGYANSDALYDALKKGDYKGEWVIPPPDLLCGRELNSDVTVHKANLFDHRNDGVFKGTFKTVNENPRNRYWSSLDNYNTIVVWCADFAEGDLLWSVKDGSKLFCRPVRLEPAA